MEAVSRGCGRVPAGRRREALRPVYAAPAEKAVGLFEEAMRNPELAWDLMRKATKGGRPG